MADVNTLDARLRARALEQARKELEGVISRLANFKFEGCNTPFGWTAIKTEQGTKDLGAFLHEAGRQFLALQANDLGNLSIREFMSQVDTLSKDVGELRNMVEDLPRGE